MRPAEQKRALRKTLRAQRGALSSVDAARIDAQLSSRLSRLCRAHRRVALFWPMLERREVDLRALDTALRSEGVELYYPWLPSAGEQLPATFKRVQNPSDLVRHEFGFYQPDRAAALAANLDVIVAPALAATRLGHRLGYGAGTYDRLLGAYSQAETVVVVRSHELFDTLPLEPHDQAARWVVTELETIGPIG